ncbi:ABC transporter substrate-binding protein [Bdellovibrio sp. HCB337]|uniref:ABC transporter substrate-binding protein n=1 Tax=Bdellovibrio sp. HCB337 TaxID=3394358 RepID=UPI0039A6CC15
MKRLFCGLILASVCSAAQAKTLVYCSEGSPASFNPQLVADGTSLNTAHPIYNGLVEFEIGTTKVVPVLAESYTISKDKLTYTFKLRKGVKFHATKTFTPKRDFNADDVLFSFEKQWKKDHPYHNVGGGTYEYFEGMDMGKVIKSIKAIDPMTVEIALNYPEAPFLANMAMPFMSILSKEYADQLATENKKEQIDLAPVGTGPFVFQSYAKGSSIKYSSFDKYWGKKGNVEKLIFAITPDANVRAQKLKTGECQFATDPAPSDLQALQADSKLHVASAPGMNVGYLAMNVTKKPFDNVLVRKAINHALNRKAYIDAIFLGNATVAKNPLPPTIWSYNESVKDHDYNPEKAKELLKQAGLANGFETEMWTMPVSRPYNPNGKKLGEMMQADLAKVGIKVKLVTFDWPTYLAKSKAGEHALIQFGWTGDNGDPDNFLGILLGCSSVDSGSNYARWCHKPFNDLILEAKKNTDVKKRTDLYKKAQVIFKDEAPWVTIDHSTVFKAMSKNVKNYKMDPLGADIFNHVSIE